MIVEGARLATSGEVSGSVARPAMSPSGWVRATVATTADPSGTRPRRRLGPWTRAAGWRCPRPEQDVLGAQADPVVAQHLEGDLGVGVPAVAQTSSLAVEPVGGDAR